MQPVLTIAIPTYNRKDKLEMCLQHILEETKNSDAIEILVSDNCSTDGTEEFMREFIVRHSEINYWRNSENLGADRNFLNCYERAIGDYILLLGDDDMLLPGSIEQILVSIKKNPVAIFLNTSELTDTNPLRSTSPQIKEQGELIFDDRNKILEIIGIFITFMSSFVLRTDLVRAIPNKEQYIGSYFIQSHIALKTMENDGIYILNTYNCLAESSNETVDYDLYYVWFESYHKLLTTTALESGFSREMLDKVYSVSLWNTVRGFVFHFRLRCKNQRNWNKKYVYKNLKGKKIDMLIIKLFVVSPVWMLRIYRAVRCRLSGHEI